MPPTFPIDTPDSSDSFARLLFNNPVQEVGLGVCFSGLYKTGMFYQSIQGRIHASLKG